MLAAPWGAESADFAGVEAKQWLVVCFCKLASTVWALFFSSIGGWLPAETAPSEPAALFSWLSGHEGVLAAVGASLESGEPAWCTVRRSRGGHVLVAEHASPAGELDVRGVDHAPGLVGIRYDLEQEPGALLVDRHVAELVDDREPRPGDLPELRVEPPPFRAAQPHEQPGRGEEPDRYRAHAREPAQRDREMRLAGATGRRARD